MSSMCDSLTAPTVTGLKNRKGWDALKKTLNLSQDDAANSWVFFFTSPRLFCNRWGYKTPLLQDTCVAAGHVTSVRPSATWSCMKTAALLLLLPPHTRHKAMENLKQFLFVLSAAGAAGFVAIIFVLRWVLHFKEGLAWDGGLAEFNWHPVLIVTGFIFLQGIGEMALSVQREHTVRKCGSWSRNVSKRRKLLRKAKWNKALVFNETRGRGYCCKLHNDSQKKKKRATNSMKAGI